MFLTICQVAGSRERAKSSRYELKNLSILSGLTYLQNVNNKF